MIFIWGSYARHRTLYDSAPCRRCGGVQPIEFQRSWRTGHFFFFPLFSFSETVFSRCGACGRDGVASFPRVLPPLPFLDRLGFTIPLGAIGAVFVAFFLLVATAKPSSAQRTADGTPTAAAEGGNLRHELDRHLATQDVYRTDEEAAIVKAVGDLIRQRYVGVGTVHVAARVFDAAASPPPNAKRAVVLIELKNLRGTDDGARKVMLDDIHSALANVLAPADEVIVGVKGTILYGAFAAGSVGSPWGRTRVDVAVNETLDDALGQWTRIDAPPSPAASP